MKKNVIENTIINTMVMKKYNSNFTHAYMSDEGTIEVVRSHKIRKDEHIFVGCILPTKVYEEKIQRWNECYGEEDTSMDSVYFMEDLPDALHFTIASKYTRHNTHEALKSLMENNGYSVVTVW